VTGFPSDMLTLCFSDLTNSFECTSAMTLVELHSFEEQTLPAF